MEATLIINRKTLHGVGLRNFRTCNDPYRPDRVAKILAGKKYRIPSRAGLAETRISGSSQFDLEGLELIQFRISSHHADSSNLVIVDLREEPHGYCMGSEHSYPVSWYSLKDWYSRGKNWKEVEDTETRLLCTIRKQETVTLHHVTAKDKDTGGIKASETIILQRPRVFSERELVAVQRHLGYVRIAITDHMKPEDDDGDDIRIFFDSLSRGTWKHYHCAAGKGRTTTLMVINDMMVNYEREELTFEDFLIRQYLLGGANLLRISKIPWKRDIARDRLIFLRRYFEYIRTTAHGDRVFFRTWLAGR